MLVLALLLSAAPAFPEGLTHPLLASVDRWKWPAPTAFTAAWSAGQADTSGYRVVHGKVTLADAQSVSGYFLLVDDEGQLVLEPLVVTGTEDLKGTRWRATPAEGDQWELRGSANQPARLRMLERLPSAVAAVDLIPWTYASTLLKASGPLYAEKAGGSKEFTELLTTLADDPEKTRAWAAANAKDDALFERLRQFRPMGSCSMDTRPQEAARLFAELAFARGDLGHFLQLQVRIMGDQFARVAWSSYGEAAHGTQSERLLSTGIDVDQFLLGLLIARPDRDEGLGVWRLARSIREAGRTEQLLPIVRRLAESPTTDAFNRLRALQVWTFVTANPDPAARSRASYDVALKAAGRLELTFLQKAWVAQEVKGDR